MRWVGGTLCYYTFIRFQSQPHAHDQAHIFPILLHSKSFPYLHREHTEEKNIFQLQYCCCCSKSVVFKMEFHVSDCGIPFHHRVASAQTKTGKREGKSPVEMWWWKKKLWLRIMRHFSSSPGFGFLCKKFLWKKTCRDFCFIFQAFLSFSGKIFRAKTFIVTLIKMNISTNSWAALAK